VAVADIHPAYRHDGILRFELTAHQLIRSGYRDHIFDTLQSKKKRGIQRPLVVQDTDGYPISPGHRPGFACIALHYRDDCIYLAIGCGVAHDNQHTSSFDSYVKNCG